MAIFLHRDSWSLVVRYWRFLIFYSLLLLVLSNCANPMASIQSEIGIFKKTHPENFGNIKINKTNVHYAWAGDRTKRVIVFVHGSPGSWEGWAHFLVNKELSERFYLLAIDRLGYGGSNKGVSEPSLESQALAVLAVLDSAQNHEPAILVGHSFGGPVIAKVAMIAPERIGGLIFVASSVSPDLEKIKWFQYPASWWPIRSLIPSDLRVCNEEIFSLKNELKSMLNDWKLIRAKVAIIHGVTDRLVPIENVDFIAAKIDSSSILKTEKIPDQGHFIPWERPDLILEAISVIGGR